MAVLMGLWHHFGTTTFSLENVVTATRFTETDFTPHRISASTTRCLKARPS
jgi:hypothetical protein